MIKLGLRHAAILSFVLFFGGLGAIWVGADWRAAVGVFLVVWANNMGRDIQRTVQEARELSEVQRMFEQGTAGPIFKAGEPYGDQPSDTGDEASGD